MKRKPLQGLVTVLRFNWHFFVLALAGILFLPLAAYWFTPDHLTIALFLAAAGLLVIATSMAATLHAYDLTGLYSLRWLEPWMSGATEAANIHSGFDETTELLREKYPGVKWHVFDFYDPAKHTEISIKRARAVHPPQHGTRGISTSRVPLENQSLDRIVLMLSAHEIRDHGERVTFFREHYRVLAEDGAVIVTEHLRDPSNIIAYTLGAWHFHPRSEWLATFGEAGFEIAAEMKNNLLITTFILRKHETAPEIVGVLLICLALMHIVLPRYFKWREELQGVSLITRQILHVHTFFIALTVFLMGLLCLTSARDLLTTPLGGRIVLGLFIFWFCRLILQFFGYSSKLWRGKPFETFMHIAFSLLWVYLSAVFLLTFLG